MQIPWLEKNHFLVQGRIVFGALPPVRREEGFSQACFARALSFLEGSAYDLITFTGPTSSYHHLRGSDFSIWMTLRALRMLTTGTEECTPAPFWGGLRACTVQGLNEDHCYLRSFLYVTDFCLSHLCWKYIFTSVLTIPSLVSFFLYGNCALLCFSNKNLKFLVYLARLKLHRAIVQPRNRSENFTLWKWRMH